MSKTSETGHAKNMTNLGSMITSIIAFGDKYNPAKESIKLASLQTLLSSTKESFNAYYAAQSAYGKAVDDRESAFEPLSKLITRVNNALKASDTTTRNDDTIKTIIRKLQGQRASTKLTEEEQQAMGTEGTPKRQISTAQMSYDSRLENLDKLIIHLSDIGEYMPNEEELKVETLQTLSTKLKEVNGAVVAAYIALERARADRNGILYQPLTGLVDRAIDTKSYIKSVYGTTSPEYKQVGSIQFKTRLIN
jgi:hypothetical protein